MITSWQLYWLTRMDYFSGFFQVIGSITGIALFVLLIMSMFFKSLSYGEDSDAVRSIKFFKVALWVFPFCLITNIFAFFIPSTKEMAAILVIPKIVNNQKVQQLPDKVLDLANSWLEELKTKEKSE